MDIIAAYREAGTFRGAAVISGTTHKTVRRVIARHEEGGSVPARLPRPRNYDGVAVLVAERVAKTAARISAKRLLPGCPGGGVLRVGPELPATKNDESGRHSPSRSSSSVKPALHSSITSMVRAIWSRVASYSMRQEMSESTFASNSTATPAVDIPGIDGMPLLGPIRSA